MCEEGPLHELTRLTARRRRAVPARGSKAARYPPEEMRHDWTPQSTANPLSGRKAAICQSVYVRILVMSRSMIDAQRPFP
jgi:hypothetical protein